MIKVGYLMTTNALPVTSDGGMVAWKSTRVCACVCECGAFNPSSSSILLGGCFLSRVPKLATAIGRTHTHRAQYPSQKGCELTRRTRFESSDGLQGFGHRDQILQRGPLRSLQKHKRDGVFTMNLKKNLHNETTLRDRLLVVVLKGLV